MFIGRQEELKELKRIAGLPKASLVVCCGRRRIGKSTLIEHFAKEYADFYEFQGLAPHDQIDNQDLLENFSQQLAAQLNLPQMGFSNWHDAFSLLGKFTESKHVLIFLDEISWMAADTPDFAGQLKIAWDTIFKKNPRLMLVVCGSVSSWIDKNILNSADFMGRISLSLNLKELSLPECNAFWGMSQSHTSALEKCRILSITGGVPKYLEEIDITASAESNITNLCFRESGFLFNEFDKIFNDIFNRRSETYKKVINKLTDGAKSFKQICQALKVDPNGAISDYLNDLITSGFITRDYTYSPKTGKRTKFSRFRLKDNNIRFYLKYIEPKKEKIANGLFNNTQAGDILAFETIMGLQFENLILSNLNEIIHILNINPTRVISASSYFQNKTLRQLACQIDLLIDTQYTIYICEIKCRNKISKKVIEEVRQKGERLKIDRNKSIRYVLIHTGALAPDMEKSEFDAIISFDDLLKY